MKLTENVDYYIDKDSGLLVFTEQYLYKRGYCCGNGCKHCVYEPEHTKGNDIVKKYWMNLLQDNCNQGIP